ncbi:hypothetical protein A9Q81_03805 [Gammaproteobacteria bacterium 42_54_T18]|nr:hypothetical protein A9Q81_03805 [Gammaproteobacteria bacterium 42_54_T18]
MTTYQQKKLQNAVDLLLSKKNTEDHIWLPDSLKFIKQHGKDVIADVTISLIDKKQNSIIVISFRNVNERIEGLKRIESLRLEQQYLKEELKKASPNTQMIGSSQLMLDVVEQIEQVASTNASVLICGETGTGKELVANAVHQLIKRKDKAFIKVNCGALQANLIESEFFGHEKGTFTGATSRRIGRFKLADGGTIFLDEIGDIPANLQVKLLRVLQEGEFEPVGSAVTQKVNIRIIAATHKDLLQAVQDGEFREYLYYRLNVFPINVPALRDRGDDLITIAQTFKDYFCEQMGRSIGDFDHQQISQLRSHHWPGNIRELRNIIERAVITAKNDTLDLQRALPSSNVETTSDIQDPPVASIKSAKNQNVSEPVITDNSHIFNESQLRDIEKSNIVRALTQCNGKISGNKGAAKLLGLKPSTLNSRIKTYEIDYDNS